MRSRSPRSRRRASGTEWVQRAACAGELLDRHIVDGQLRRASLDGAVGEPSPCSTTMPPSSSHCCRCIARRVNSGGAPRPSTSSTAQSKPSPTREAQGSWFDAPADGGLIVRPRDPADGATPSGAALMGEALVMASMLADPDTAGRYNDLAAQTVGRAAILLCPRAACRGSLARGDRGLAGPVLCTSPRRRRTCWPWRARRHRVMRWSRRQ